MLNVTKEQKGTVLSIKLSGPIDASESFEQLLGPPAGEMEIFCKDITRINSIGVKAWIRYFESAQEKGTKLKFVECSTAIVEQLNLISNFSCGGEIESIYVPFSCTKCRSMMDILFKTDDLKKINTKFPDMKCAKCGGVAAFDDVLKEFLSFLSN